MRSYCGTWRCGSISWNCGLIGVGGVNCGVCVCVCTCDLTQR